jgi:hypothetical protein
MSLAATIERSRRDVEQWRYTDLNALLKHKPKFHVETTPFDWSALVASRISEHRAVFLNGVLQAEHSTPNILHGDSGNGYVLSLSGAPQPVILVCLSDNSVPESNLELAITVAANTMATIIEHHHHAGSGSAVIDLSIAVDDGATFIHNKILHAQHDAAHLARGTVRVGTQATYRNFALIKDTRLVRNEIDVTLDGQHAHVALNGLMLLRDHQHGDTWTRITHAKPNGTSGEIYKSVIGNQAKGAFQGKIIVAKDAQKTHGQQISRALLLSDQAEMNAKPELEIYADDVSCSHGSTVGDIDADALFYLRTRGLSKEEAKAILLRGFVGEVVNELQSAEGRDYFHTLIEGWLHEQN